VAKNPKIVPSGIHTSPAAPELSEQQWETLQLALAGNNRKKVVAIPPEARRQILDVCRRYMSSHEAYHGFVHEAAYVKALKEFGAATARFLKLRDRYFDEKAGSNDHTTQFNLQTCLSRFLPGDGPQRMKILQFFIAVLAIHDAVKQELEHFSTGMNQGGFPNQL
jgi:hypothetical protein